MEDISEATWRHYTDVWRSFVIKEIFILVSMPDAYFYTKEFGIVMVTSLFLIFNPNLILFVSNNTWRKSSKNVTKNN